MPRLKLCTKTFSSVTNFSEDNTKFFAQKNNFVYFLDPKKLDKILSLLCLLGDFNEYYTYSDERNLTQWLKDKKLLNQEILNEISCRKTECHIREKINNIISFDNYFSDTFLVFKKFLKNFLFNIAAFEYIKENQNRINEYVSNILVFFEKNNILKEKPYPFQFFINCLFETEKVKMYDEIMFDENFEIKCFLNKKPAEYFNVEKIINNREILFFESIKPDSIMDFEIFYDKNNPFFSNIDKYLQLSEYMSIQKQTVEQHSYMAAALKKELYFQGTRNYSGANMCILNLNQIFYMCMNEENRQKLNKLLPYRAEDLIFYYKINADKTSEKLNYLQIKKEI